MPHPGPFEDRRREWCVCVTGHRDAASLGPWAYAPAGRREFMPPGAAELRDPVTIAIWLGIPYRVVNLFAPQEV